MHTASTCAPAAAGSSGAATAARRRVIDAPTRMFHWLFALSFVGAYLSSDGERWRTLHVTLGYALAGLLAFRLLYGLFGPRHARIGLLFRKLASAPTWLRSLADAARHGTLQGTNWRQGQNLLLALAVVALLLLALPLTLSGLGAYNGWGDAFGGDWLEELHEFFGEAFLALVLAHLGSIAGLSLLRRRNQAMPMITGHTDGAGPDLVKRDHALLAALLLLAVAGYVGWEWQHSPNGLLPAEVWVQATPGRHHDDDD